MQSTLKVDTQFMIEGFFFHFNGHSHELWLSAKCHFCAQNNLICQILPEFFFWGGDTVDFFVHLCALFDCQLFPCSFTVPFKGHSITDKIKPFQPGSFYKHVNFVNWIYCEIYKAVQLQYPNLKKILCILLIWE